MRMPCKWLVLHLGILLLRSQIACAVGAPWIQQTEDAAWPARDAFAVATLGDGSVLVLGGKRGNDPANDVWLTSPDDAGSEWQLQTASAEWSPRKFAAAVTLPDGSVLLMGGFDGHFVSFNDVWRTTASSQGATWTQVTGAAEWSGRYSFTAAALLDGSLLVMGGCCLYNDVWRSTPASKGASWTLQLLAAPWSRRAYHAVVALPNATHPSEPGGILLMGGFGQSGSSRVYHNDVWLGSNDGTFWKQQTAAAGWSGRMSVSAIVLPDGSVLALMGASQGSGGRYNLHGDVWRSPPGAAGTTWERQTAVTGWRPRIGVAALLTSGAFKGAVMLMGGFLYDASGQPTQANDVWRTELVCNVHAPGNGSMGNCVHPADSRTSCRPTCYEGYTLSNDMECLDGNVFPALCIPNPCDVPRVPPDHGSRGDCPDTLLSGKSCQPTCDPGYTVTGPSHCYLGDLSAALCTPDPCKVVPPLHGNLGDCLANISSGSSCQPACDPGYTVGGRTYCMLGQLTSAQCSPDPCAVSGVPDHATIGDCPALLQSGSSCQPVCETGYTVSGLTTCSLGILSPAVCNANPCNLRNALQHVQQGNCTDELESEEMCQPTCPGGYAISGPVVCFLGRLTLPSCLPNPCVVLHGPEHGDRGDCPQVLQSEQSCQPTCDDGYVVSGPLTCKLGNLSLAKCGEEACVLDETPANGFRGNCSRLLQSGATCQPVCLDGYTVSGPTACSLGNLSLAECSPDPCNATQALMSVEAGNCTDWLQSGELCQPTCPAGYTISGPLLCYLGNLTPTSCDANPCPILAGPDHGNRGDCPTFLQSGQTCHFACDDGHVPSGPVSCELGNLSAATCLEAYCLLDAFLENGFLGDCPRQLPSGGICQLVCLEGYTVSGPMSCFLGNLSNATCEPSSCNSSEAPENGGVGNCPPALESDGICQPTCDEGYMPSGVSYCFLGNFTSATCEQRPCILNSSNFPECGGAGNCPNILQSGQSCLPSCNPGFLLSHPLSCWLGELSISSPLSSNGSMMLTCHANHLDPICIPSPCVVPMPTHGDYGDCPEFLPSGAACLVRCNAGYHPSGYSSCLFGSLIAGTCLQNLNTSTSTTSTTTTSSTTSTTTMNTTLDIMTITSDNSTNTTNTTTLGIMMALSDSTSNASNSTTNATLDIMTIMALSDNTTNTTNITNDTLDILAMMILSNITFNETSNATTTPIQVSNTTFNTTSNTTTTITAISVMPTNITNLSTSTTTSFLRCPPCPPCPSSELSLPPFRESDDSSFISQGAPVFFWTGIAALAATSLMACLLLLLGRRGKKKKLETSDAQTEEDPFSDMVCMTVHREVQEHHKEVQEQSEAELFKERLACEKFQKQLQTQAQFLDDMDAELARERSLRGEVDERLRSNLLDFQKLEAELAGERLNIQELQQKHGAADEERAQLIVDKTKLSHDTKQLSKELNEERLLNRELQGKLQTQIRELQEMEFELASERAKMREFLQFLRATEEFQGRLNGNENVEMLEAELESERAKVDELEQRQRSTEDDRAELFKELGEERCLNRKLQGRLESNLDDFQEIEIELASERAIRQELQHNQLSREDPQKNESRSSGRPPAEDQRELSRHSTSSRSLPSPEDVFVWHQMAAPMLETWREMLTQLRTPMEPSTQKLSMVKHRGRNLMAEPWPSMREQQQASWQLEQGAAPIALRQRQLTGVSSGQLPGAVDPARSWPQSLPQNSASWPQSFPQSSTSLPRRFPQDSAGNASNMFGRPVNPARTWRQNLPESSAGDPSRAPRPANGWIQNFAPSWQQNPSGTAASGASASDPYSQQATAPSKAVEDALQRWRR